MRRAASQYAFRPTSRSSQKLCSRPATSLRASAKFRPAIRSLACRRSTRSSKRKASMPPSVPAGRSTFLRPSSSSTRSARGSYTFAYPVRRSRARSRAAASSSLDDGFAMPSRDAGAMQDKSSRNSPASTYRRVTTRSFASGASSGSWSPRRAFMSFVSSRVASLVTISASRASPASQATHLCRSRRGRCSLGWREALHRSCRPPHARDHRT